MFACALPYKPPVWACGGYKGKGEGIYDLRLTIFDWPYPPCGDQALCYRIPGDPMGRHAKAPMPTRHL